MSPADPDSDPNQTTVADAEFTFELRVCGWAERQWPPTGTLAEDRTHIVARQLGTKRRRWDTIVVECDRAELRRRARLGEQRLDSDLLHVVRGAPAVWTYYRDTLSHPGYPWRYVREAIHRAADRGLVETRRRGGRIELRRVHTYPDWVHRIVAIENKPDLDASAARALGDQLRRDVALGLADEVWVATRATGERVEPALLERLPVEVGILTVGADSTGDLDVQVAWHPRSLATDRSGTRILDAPSGGEYDQSAWRFDYADADWKAEKRLEIAERAYERGWRSYLDTMRPDCRHFELRRAGRDTLPWCTAKGCSQTARECSGSCSAFSPEPPSWRQHGWPIEGGPGRAVKRLLAAQRVRHRPGLADQEESGS